MIFRSQSSPSYPNGHLNTTVSMPKFMSHKVLHALVDCCIEIFIKAYSDVVAVFHWANSKFWFYGNDDIQTETFLCFCVLLFIMVILNGSTRTVRDILFLGRFKTCLLFYISQDRLARCYTLLAAIWIIIEKFSRWKTIKIQLNLILVSNDIS